MILSRYMLTRGVRVGMYPCWIPTVVWNQSPNAAVEEDGTSGLFKEIVNDSDKVGAGVVLLHGCP